MSALPETPQCPRCSAALERIGGLCPTCVARGGLANAGWLEARPTQPAGENPVIPGWRITGTLGAGGMGRVYQAESESDGTRAAIKVLDARWTHDAVMAARFEGEAEMLRRLDHPNIVRLLETTETDDGRLCIAMEFVEGCDLGHLLWAEKFGPARAAELFGKVCAAVEFAHAQGFVHRDIKPSNILAGRDGTVKLADFGLAKELAGAGNSVIGGLTATTDQFGTAYYLAPERMVSAKPGGPQADVFSLGVLLYHLLTGQMPLGKFTPLSQLTGLPVELDGIISHALEANPERRTADVTALRTAFEQVWQDHVAGAFRARKIRRAALTGMGVIFTAAAAAAGALWQRERMKPPPPPVFEEPSKATTAKPWSNSLGMKFVPVSGTKVLFSIWETRRRDFEPFRIADRGSISQWRSDQAELVKRGDSSIVTFDESGGLTLGTWEDPGFPVTPDHPAGGIGIRDAQFFCLWLTWREQTEGRLPPGARYRLPTTAEWFTACGGANTALRPGNLAGPEARDSRWPKERPTLDVRDPFPRTSPVGSFPPELHGLYDLSGNVCEWVQDRDEPTNFKPIESSAQLRGPSCVDGTPQTVAFSHRRLPLRHLRLAIAGFRMVLEMNGP